MATSIDEHFLTSVSSCPAGDGPALGAGEAEYLQQVLVAQVQSRHTDFASRWLQSQGEGFYTIGSAGHESNAAVARALAPTDPALLHYRSAAFYLARCLQAGSESGVGDVLDGVASSVEDQISGGRHKVIGSRRLAVVPQTSTIASHLPRAVGLALALDLGASEHETPWPSGSVVVASFGDASVNHSTAVGAFNTAGYLAHRGTPLPLLLVCEDNGLGISTRTPRGWAERMLSSLPAIEYAAADGSDPLGLRSVVTSAVDTVRSERRPVLLHLRTVRFLGHAGSDVELAYRSPSEIEADLAEDPLLATARLLVRSGTLAVDEVVDLYERTRQDVMAAAKDRVGAVRLTRPDDVVRPLVETRAAMVAREAAACSPTRAAPFHGILPEDGPALTLAQTINATLADAMAARPDTVVFGEDVGRKGGVYGVTRGLRKTFGGLRVFDTLLDEQTVLGTALGMALAGYLPVPEIQYLAYLHNAEDQLRGEAATLRFFSNGQYQNGMVVRVAGLAYQKGFGGHFHNDNSLAVLRDIPGIAVAVASHPSSAAGLLRNCLALARVEGRVCVYVEPIALYHQRDLHQAEDGAWLAPYAAPGSWDPEATAVGTTRSYGTGHDLLVLTFGNGVPMSLRAARRLEQQQIATTVVDLQWVSPLPVAALLEAAAGFERILVVDETRASGGVSESVVTALGQAGNPARVRRVTSHDSFIPLGPAAGAVLLSEDDVVEAARGLLQPEPWRSPGRHRAE
ncbi:thiamine pyrophosphate-dependent enzyme [Nocardioides euryhalodurans]|uniref:thiamine pyrophosphate-dependent enzyme n=1 Tax=Nocardioides euryhalodurans TaxID=2518370 RepID=UPI001ABEE25D|nr:thiamine pyrophosphate-dependent enzyme [Nocardioides euryhalodurans]